MHIKFMKGVTKNISLFSLPPPSPLPNIQMVAFLISLPSLTHLQFGTPQCV